MKLEEKSLTERLLDAIPGNRKAAFLACFAVGFLVHLYAFTNIIPNCDGLSRVYDEQQMTVSGRWFLHFASMLHGYIQAPALIGALSLVFLSAGAMLTCDILDLRGVSTNILAACFMVLTPAVTYTYMFIFTASAYAFAILLAILSVWLTRRYRWGFALGAVTVAMSIGTYQAYFALAAGLSVCCVILDAMDESLELKAVFVRIGRLLGMLALGAVLYGIILVIFLKCKDLTLLSYRGMNEGFSLSALISSIDDVYIYIVKYFLVPGSQSFITKPMVLIHIGLFALAGVGLLRQRGHRAHPVRTVLLIGGVGVLPLGCNFSQLLSSNTPIMCYAFVVCYLMALKCIELGNFRHISRAAKAACLVLLLLFAQTANIAYTASATAHRATQAFATNLVSRVEQCEGYDAEMEVIVIGGFPDSVYYSGVEGFAYTEHFSCLSSSAMPRNKHIYYYLNDWLNVPWQEPQEALLIEIAASEEFAAMPLYPSDGSVQIVDGRVIVKLAETYTPKKDYEIAYENRK